jgi:hypothetical protein
MLGILPGDLALSFCYLPQVYKPYPGHAGTLESTDKWLELHDLRTGKFIKKIVLPDPRPVVLKAKISNIDGQVYLLTARTEYEYGPADFKYYLEKLDIEKESSQVLVSRDSAIKDFSLFDDEACAVLVESDGELEAISLADGRVVSHFKGDFIFSSCITVQAGRIFCAGDDQGFLNFFSLENDAPAGTSPSSPPEMSTGIADNWQFTRIENAAPGPEATRPAEEIPAVPGRPKEKGGFFSNLFKK